MRFEININKKHFLVILALLVITGLGVAQTAPNPGHTISEVAGASPNCLSNPTHPSCSAIVGSSWLSSQGGTGNVAIAAANAFSLEGYRVSAFCRGDGSNCPTVPSQYVRKYPSTTFCGPGNAFYCGSRPIADLSLNPTTPFYDFANGVYKAGSSSGADCQWVLCSG